jgi:hypothetical protein
MATLCLVQHCAVYNDIAPYISILTTDAHATVDSIYRGVSATKLLNKYGKHTQYQLYHATPAQRIAWGILGTPDRPGQSTHELASDGVAYPNVRAFQPLAWWQQGFDVNAADVDRVIAQAAAHKWELFRPYSSGVELHHLNFKKRPSPTVHTVARIFRLRHTLPRS